jgi:hypothetical protein
MSAYVDDLIEYGGTYRGDGAAQAARVGARNGDRWCHLYADTEEELHAFAQRIGMKRVWAQVSRTGIPHYDLTPRRRVSAVKHGAKALIRRDACMFRRSWRARSATPGASPRPDDKENDR